MELEKAVSYYSFDGKGIRTYLCSCLAGFYNISEKDISTVNRWVSDLHNASLVMDDIEDDSQIRRCKPTSHLIYGVPVALSSASITIFRTLHEIQRTTTVGPEILELLYYAHVGQGIDIQHFTYKTKPNLLEYEKLVQYKTGNLLLILLELICYFGKNDENFVNREIIKDAVIRFSIFYQIRDDYINLACPKYWKEKGFCTDIQDGKMNYLLLLANVNNVPLDLSCVDVESKKHLLQNMHVARLFDETYDKLEELKTSVLNVLPIQNVFDLIPYHRFDLSNLELV